jgi:hypothetical protein
MRHAEPFILGGFVSPSLMGSSSIAPVGIIVSALDDCHVYEGRLQEKIEESL